MVYPCFGHRLWYVMQIEWESNHNIKRLGRVWNDIQSSWSLRFHQLIQGPSQQVAVAAASQPWLSGEPTSVFSFSLSLVCHPRWAHLGGRIRSSCGRCPSPLERLAMASLQCQTIMHFALPWRTLKVALVSQIVFCFSAPVSSLCCRFEVFWSREFPTLLFAFLRFRSFIRFDLPMRFFNKVIFIDLNTWLLLLLFFPPASSVVADS